VQVHIVQMLRTSLLLSRRTLLTQSSRLMSTAVRSTTASGVGGSAVYETAKAVDEYLQFHFATEEELVPYSAPPPGALGFTKRMALKCDAASGRGRALDVGCSVGGASFELCRSFDEVVGVDFSQAFVDAAAAMARDGEREYSAAMQASIQETRTARVDPAVERSKASFRQGDACALPAELGEFDAVLAGNLLCRLPNPEAFLARCKEIVRPGGVLVLVSPYSWLEEYTPRERWLGGYRDEAGDALSSADAVAAILGDVFTLEAEEDMPFLIREHERKFQWGVSHGATWRRNA